MTTTTASNLRAFMRSCQQFWTTQWLMKPTRNGENKPTQIGYEESLIGVFADMKSVIDKPKVFFATPGDVITEADCISIFNSEFSSSWQDVKARFVSGTIFPYPIIPNYTPNS